jgi:flagellar basal body-associated protein FliL
LFSALAEENQTITVGRETLRREALDKLKRLLFQMKRDGADAIEDFYFTKFVVQQ